MREVTNELIGESGVDMPFGTGHDFGFRGAAPEAGSEYPIHRDFGGL
jgi:hypothetical protein